MPTQILEQPVLKIATNDLEIQEVIRLLHKANLPTADIDDDKLLYLLKAGNKTIGTAGLEIFEDCALLRSVSVIQEEQGKGYGKIINEAIEDYVKEAGINCLYLLTTTAKGFFDKLGYCMITRDESPAAIQQTESFKSLCPSTAVLMIKRI